MNLIDGLARLIPNRFVRPHPVVATVRLAGVISAQGVGPRGGLALSGVAHALERAFKVRGARAVALLVNSPGGAPAQSSLIAKRVRALSLESGLPVIAFVEDVAASGGYWLASAADEIFADETSIVGSIGVISAGFGFADLLARLGVERRVHATGPYKGMLDPFRPESEADVARLKSLHGDLFASFIAQIRQRRGARLKANDEDLFSGTVWTGRQAVEIGLVDGIGDVRQVMRARYGEKVRLVNLPVEGRGWLRRRLGLSGAGRGTRLATELIAALEDRLAWSRFGL